MLRLLICAAFVLGLAAVHAEDEKPRKETTFEGVIKKVDPSAHRLTVTLKGKKSPPDAEFHILNSTRFIFTSGEDTREVRGKQAYRDKRLAEGARVNILADAKNGLREVRVSPAPKKTGK